MVELFADAYYYNITQGLNIKQCLPPLDMHNFEAIMQRIIQKLEEDLETLRELSQEAPDNKEILQDIAALQEKITICQKYLNSKTEELQNNLIFANTSSDNLFVLEDIKSIDSSYYKGISNVLKFLLDKRKTSDPRKQKALTNNKFRNGTREIKKGQIRLYYKTLPNDIYYIFLITIKKDDWSKRDDNKLSKRLKHIQKEFDYYLKMSPEELTQELKVHQLFLETISDKLQATPKSADFTSLVNEESKEEIIDEAIEEAIENFDPDITSLEPRWKRVYEIAQWLYDSTGTINVKLNYEIRGFKFGRWIKEQKDAYEQGELSPLQIKLLEDLHIRWRHQKTEKSIPEPAPEAITMAPIVQNKLEKMWRQKYLLAKQFYEEHGHLKIPQIYEINGVKLGLWINTQRQIFKKGKMHPYRQKLLTEIGMIWSIYKPRKEKVAQPTKQLEEDIHQIYTKLQTLDSSQRDLFEVMIENDGEALSQIDKNHQIGK